MLVLDRYRQALRKAAARSVGQDSNQPNITALQQKIRQHHSEILSLPVNDDAILIQNPDGSFMYMHGFSAWGGPDFWP
jgi:hypothetical protein